MLKRIKLKNSTILLVGIVILIIGFSLGFYEYFIEKKNHAFSEMNILLYESEIPENIEPEEADIPEEKPQEETKPENNDNPNSSNNYNYLGILEIPKIGVKGGFFDFNSPYNNVDYNITLIKGSTFPTQENNNLILAAHSGICPVCYFDKLYQLNVGDNAYIYLSLIHI